MKNAIKYFTFLVVGIIFLYASLILSSQFIFTKKIHLSCKGQWTQRSTESNQVTNKQMRTSSESVIISITQYPLSKPFIQINNRLNLLTSKVNENEKLKVMHMDEEQIFGGERNYYDEWRYDFYGVTFNRITKSIEIEKTTGNEKLGNKESQTFDGVCEVVKPL